MTLKTLGVVRTPFKDKFGTPRQSQIARNTVSKIVLDKKIAPPETLEGLQINTYIWVLFWFHLNRSKKAITKVHPPRLRGKTMGVLATRSPHRPNPLGQSLGKIVDIQKHVLYVEGLDVVDKTPVVDIKPYLPDFDQPKEKTFLWVEQTPFPRLDVVFAEGLLADLSKKERTVFETQLTEILSEDPRPLAYLNKPLHQYWVKYGEYDVGFEIDGETLRVNKIKS